MLELIFAFVTTFGPVPLQDEGAPIAPTDIVAGTQNVPLRKPLVNRSPGTQLVLFVRDTSSLTGTGERSNADFETAVPTGSVQGILRNANGASIEYEHTGYVYYRGFSGLVMTESAPSGEQSMFSELELEATVDLPQVRFVWLDRAGRTIRDVPPPR